MILDLHLWNYSAAYTNDIPLLISSFLSQHFILFAACSCPSQASQIRSTNSQFHGSVRHEMEHRKLQEKKMEVKEKLDKYEERKLSIFCSELGIPVCVMHQEDMVPKLMDFFEGLYATTVGLCAEKEQIDLTDIMYVSCIFFSSVANLDRES
ncbi:hypothetical protein BC332_19426 [Capsicum chinense]|nr:hypothetical protein BC332_19426 [Capsicum chinense]